MPILSIKEIADIINGKLISRKNNQEIIISSISIDSRTIIEPAVNLFFALVSERNNGHKYIDDLVAKGVRAFVISRSYIINEKYENCSFVIVENTLVALQNLTKWHRSKFTIPVIGITGSNGKTVVKEWLSELLFKKSVVRSPKSYNSQVGVPLSIWNIKPEHEFAIFEAGISKPGEMINLQEIINPTIGLITNLGEAHQENFSSKSEKINEKLILFKQCKKLIYCKDQNFIHQNINSNFELSNVEKISWSFVDKSANIFIQKQIQNNSCDFVAFSGVETYKISFPFKDDASIENAAHCLSLLISEQLADVDTLNMFSKLQPVAMRLEIKDGINNCTVINDYYNSDINSLQIALNFMSGHVRKTNLKRILIISDIKQAGIPDEILYREVAHLSSLNTVDLLCGIGAKISIFNNLFPPNSLFFDNTDRFIDYVKTNDFQNSYILLKGAREFHFERISSVLQKKFHQTVLEIDLNKMVNNLNYFRSLIKPETLIMVMVKAFSYGSGMVEISRVLQFHKVDYLAVAVADEGVELRQAGISLPIIVMNPEEHSFENIIEFRLEPNLYSAQIFDSFFNTLKHNAVINFPVHIKIDTGMNRLGFSTESEIQHITHKMLNQEQMIVKSVFTHLAASDEAQHDDFTIEQINRFTNLSNIITRKLPYKVILHILNSAGIERFSEFQFDMVRLGIGLYGISCDKNAKIQNVGKLKTSISQIRLVKAGETIGYGRKGKAKENLRIAVLPVGYADGYDRRLSNGVGKVFINGKIAPVIGNICMDMCMIDVTGLKVEPGDEAELFGEHISVASIAENIGTIAYEILTGISQRVKRVYLHE